MDKILILSLGLLLYTSPAYAAGSDFWSDAAVPVTFHLVLNILALHRIWTHDTDSIAWQIAWSLLSLFVPVIGPILFFGLAEMPAPLPAEERAGTSSLMRYSGFGDGSAAGVPEAAEALTDILDPPGSEENNSKDPADARQAAETGDPKAQTRYGLMLEYGDGCAKDDKGAAHWYRRAAEQGFAPGQALLSNLYEKGQGVEADIEEALFWMALAAARDARFEGRCGNLAAKLPAGKRDAALERARNWYPVKKA